jgi:hypothetical protein
MNSRTRWLYLWLAVEGLLLWLTSGFGDFTQPGHARIFVSLMWGAGIVFAAAVLIQSREKVQSAALFWCAVIGLRIAMLGCEPGDDLWRYIWEGRVQNHGLNPYELSPLASELAPLRDGTWSRINHPESAAIYPPLAELTFRALTRFTSSPLVFKLLFAAADLLTVSLLLRLLGGNYARAAWYAWNPAVVYAFAGAAHYDSLMLLTLVAAFLGLQRATTCAGGDAWRWAMLSSTALGLSIACKLVPLLLVPTWAFALKRRSPAVALALLVPAGLSLLYGGFFSVWQSLARFADVTRFNDLFWWSIEALTIPNPWQRNWPFTLVLALAICVIAWRFRDDWLRSAYWTLGFALVLSPVLHPWYATWILPLACWRGGIGWVVLSMSVISAFLLWETTPWWTAWQPNLVTRFLVIVPSLAAWIWQARVQRQLSSST